MNYFTIEKQAYNRKNCRNEITVNKLVAEGRLIANRLAKRVLEEGATPLDMLLEYNEYLAIMRCNYSDIAVFKFVDENRCIAKHEKSFLSNATEKSLIRSKHFHAGSRVMLVPNYRAAVSKERRLQGGRFKCHCCFFFLENRCLKTAVHCEDAHCAVDVQKRGTELRTGNVNPKPNI